MTRADTTWVDVLASDPAKDDRRMLEVHEVEDAYFATVDALPAALDGRRHVTQHGAQTRDVRRPVGGTTKFEGAVDAATRILGIGDQQVS